MDAASNSVTSLRTQTGSVVSALAASAAANEDAILLAGLAGSAVGVTLAVVKLVQLIRMLAAPALAAFAVIAGLGISAQLSAQYPTLGTPVEVAASLSAATVVGLGGTWLAVKVNGAVEAVKDKLFRNEGA